MKTLIAFLLLLVAAPNYANDGAYYASGNHLIPIFETDIAVKKEILTIKKFENRYIEVTVYYEFFNPKDEKTITVGFEASSSYGDVDARPKNRQHPYIRDFTVQVNEQLLTYQVAYASDSSYAANGKIISKDLKEFEKELSENPDRFFVYYFSAKFKKGTNIIKHTYNYNISSSVDFFYDFGYVLTAANRWANKRIDDFTLIVDMGEFENFLINKSFFSSAKEWIVNGIGKSRELKAGDRPALEDAVQFYIQKGNLVFQKKNFSPKDELFIYSEQSTADELHFSYYRQNDHNEPKTDFERKLLKNLPYARRGYIFKNAELQQYFGKMSWYIPNPNYIPETELLTDLEKEWIRKWSEE